MHNSTSSGELATETYTLGNTSFPNMVYGCSKNNIGVYHHTIAGIVGFGPGPHSLISQLSDSVGGKFAYCLIHYSIKHAKSKISFGAGAIVPGRSTPLVSAYYVTLEGISVQNVTYPFMVGNEKTYTRIPCMSSALLDTGSFLSYLPTDLYQQVEKVIRSAVRVPPIPFGYLKNCYIFFPNFPTIIFHLSGGVELVLTRRYTIIKYSGLWCFSIYPTNDETIIGSVLQMDYMIGYNLKNKSVSFRPTDCSKS
ncbi:aspartic proteinase CDR1-like [Impatiens glandulifera]|uniref:aspartic proteinase CDR1-like n=1 Tax=Impatiens glandulifera TaxID=253017 RepID=UPI001FB1809A|nr:aspartic proteinase CDR1-like [Impatiens glandulifera]